MGKHGERSLAFQTLYGHSLTPAQNEEQLEKIYTHAASCEGREGKSENFGWELALGVWLREKELNEAIAKLSIHRPLEDIGRMEQVLLRLGLYEIIYQYTPPKVVMSECMILAEEYGIGPGSKFVNGILDAAARNLASMRKEAQS